MSGDRVPGKVIFETQSTHKMLAAFSQASLIHIKGEYDEETFNEAFMMHTSTSPSYPIVASIETAAAMLRGNPGKRLINRSVERALHFRKEVQRLREESDSWFLISGSRKRLMRPNAGRSRREKPGMASPMPMTIICSSIRLR